MKIDLEYLDLIETLVKNNPKYDGNEDLLDDFCSEAYQKSYLILQSTEDLSSLESYLKKVVSSAIIDVLKDNGRIVRSSAGYKSVKEISITKKEEHISPKIESTIEIDLPLASEKNNSVSNFPPFLMDDLKNIKDPRDSIEEQIIRKDIIENIISMVNQINSEKPEEMYLKLFYLRYFQQKKQKEIAQEIDISQSEVSKRLVKLSRLLKEKLY